MKQIYALRKTQTNGNVLMSQKLHVQIGVGQSCNYACEYCIQGRHDNALLEREDKENRTLCGLIASRLGGYIKTASRGFDPIIAFIGGEPTLYPIKEYLPILAEGIDFKTVAFISNLSADPQFFADIAEMDFAVNITASFHGTQVDIKDFERKCLDVKKAIGAGYFQIQLTVTGENKDEYDELREFCMKNKFRFNLSLMRFKKPGETQYSFIDKPEWFDDSDSDTYLATFMDGTQKNLSRLCNYSDFSPRGMLCSVCMDDLVIKHNGKVMANTACHAPEATIGDLYEGTGPLVYHSKMIVCQDDYCYCKTPMMLRRPTR